MKKIVIAILATISGLVLLFSYKTSLDQSIPTAAGTPLGGKTTTTGSTGSTSSGSGTGSSSGSTKKSQSSTSTKPRKTSSGPKDGTYTGQTVDTVYGPVQVRITVSGGKVTNADAVVYPQGSPRDQEINSQAIPMLTSETTGTTSGNIDMISGATYTSQGYIQSLQSAIDQAK